MSRAAFVVVIESSREGKSWTVGPFYNRQEAEDAVIASEVFPDLIAWVEPCVSPDTYLSVLQDVFNDAAEHDWERRTGA